MYSSPLQGWIVLPRQVVESLWTRPWKARNDYCVYGLGKAAALRISSSLFHTDSLQRVLPLGVLRQGQSRRVGREAVQWGAAVGGGCVWAVGCSVVSLKPKHLRVVVECLEGVWCCGAVEGDR